MTKAEAKSVWEGSPMPPEHWPFPYTPEKFTDPEKTVLEQFFTNTDRPVFAIHSLPQEVIGALFSRYSRAEGGVRRIFLDEFWGDPKLGLQHVTFYLHQERGMNLQRASKRAEQFFRTVLAQYGDDSVIQMGSLHIAFEGVSQIAAKAIEDQRIGAAYIEKSTRYVDFSQPLDGGHFLFMEPSEIVKSEFAQEFLKWNNALFEAYVKHLPATIEVMRRKYPIEEQEFESTATERVVQFDQLTETSKRRARTAYERALKAKALDTIRIFLPTTTVTNLGAHFSGQAAENALNKMFASQHREVRGLALMAHEELKKVSPNFLQNVTNKYGHVKWEYLREIRQRHQRAADKWTPFINEAQMPTGGVELIDWDRDTDIKLATQILYTGQKGSVRRSKQAIRKWAGQVKAEDLANNYGDVWWSPRLAEIIAQAVPNRARAELNRRHKLPRAFEHATAEVDFYIDFGVYRDLQRNRIMSLERQPLSAEDVFIPGEFDEPGMEEVRKDYLELAERTRSLHNKLLLSNNTKLQEAAEYVSILGNKLRFNILATIRQWGFVGELRTIPGGHKTYRNAIQEAIRQILAVMPYLKPLFANVDWTPDYGLGRLKAELRTQRKLTQKAVQGDTLHT